MHMGILCVRVPQDVPMISRRKCGLKVKVQHTLKLNIGSSQPR